MRKAFKLEGLCCANCAQKIEDGINKLQQVNSARVVFMTEKLVMDVSPEVDMDSLLDEAQKICTAYEEGCVIIR